MQYAYVGESFELVVDITDPSDPSRKVDTASFRVIAPDGAVAQAGIMGIDEDGHTCRFRFEATELGINTVEISWSMGQDRFRQPLLMNVEDIGA